MSLKAVILAGSRPGAEDPVAAAEGVAHKVLAKVAGHTLLERVVRALRDAGIEDIAVSASHHAVEAEARRLGTTVLSTARGPSESVGLAFERFGAPLLVTTGDHPLLEAAWIKELVAGTPGVADVSLMLAERGRVEAAAPDTHRTWLTFADGQWSGCNLFLLASPTAERAIAAWKQVEADRKRPWRIAGRLGIGTLWSYWRGKLTLVEAVARLGNRLGVSAALVAASDGRAAIDVDKPEDLALVRRIAEFRQK
uniref:nucleotidyltransferase family protein n=1 Tax=Altererythrobacter segetis TaxID=1104773 RepID=UPI0014098291|nr:NTP transferase domain-containing protein [Altererythrobacter segetis]